MASDASQTYLETRVLTATPQQLRKMLIDGAIQKSLATQKAMKEGPRDQVYLEFEKVRAIITELMSTIKSEEAFAQRTLELYAFVLRHLLEAERQFDVVLLDEVVEILQVESQTWSMICEKWPEVDEEAKRLNGGGVGKEILAKDAKQILDQSSKANAESGFSIDTASEKFQAPPKPLGDQLPGSGFSLDA